MKRGFKFKIDINDFWYNNIQPSRWDSLTEGSVVLSFVIQINYFIATRIIFLKYTRPELPS